MTAANSLIYLPDGTMLVKEVSRPTVWLVVNGVRYGVPSIDAFQANGYTWHQVNFVRDDAVARIPMCPVDGTVVQERNGNSYAVYGGLRFRLANEDYGPRGDFSQSQIAAVVPVGFLDKIPEGGQYSRHLRGRLAPYLVWLRRQERSRRAQLIATNAVSFALGVAGGLLASLLWAAATG